MVTDLGCAACSHPCAKLRVVARSVTFDDDDDDDDEDNEWRFCVECFHCEYCQRTPIGAPFVYHTKRGRVRVACVSCALWCDECDRARPIREVAACEDSTTTCRRHPAGCHECGRELDRGAVVDDDAHGCFLCGACAAARSRK
jgi:hypothetical protein